MSYEKDKENVVLLQVRGFVQIIVRFRAEKILSTFLSCTKHFFEENDAPKWLCSTTLNKVTNWKFILIWAEEK